MDESLRNVIFFQESGSCCYNKAYLQQDKFSVLATNSHQFSFNTTAEDNVSDIEVVWA